MRLQRRPKLLQIVLGFRYVLLGPFFRIVSTKLVEASEANVMVCLRGFSVVFVAQERLDDSRGVLPQEVSVVASLLDDHDFGTNL